MAIGSYCANEAGVSNGYVIAPEYDGFETGDLYNSVFTVQNWYPNFPTSNTTAGMNEVFLSLSTLQTNINKTHNISTSSVGYSDRKMNPK